MRLLKPGVSAPRLMLPILALLLALTVTALAQSTNATLNGTITDPSGAVVPNAELVLTNTATNAEAKFTSNERGEFTFRNLTPGTYDLKVTKDGFQAYVQKGIVLTINSILQANVQLKVGGASETVTVIGDASAINFENATLQGGVAPDTLNNLPLVVSGAPRSSMSLATLLPGVTTSSSGEAFNARINGGLQMGDEAVMDGASMQQGYMNQSGMVSLQGDFQMSPDMVQEVKVVTSSYEPQYGSSTSGQLIVVTKGGTSQYHGAAFEYHRNRVLNARPWNWYADKKPFQIQNNFGANFGGPIWLPKKFFGPLGYDRDASNKTFFYFNWEAFRSAGGANVPTRTIASAKARNGDFSDWKDAAGNLIPVYYPRRSATEPLRRIQCGTQLNVLCKAEYDALVAANPFFRQYLLQYMPTPNRPGEQNNYQVPRAVPNTLINGSNVYMFRIDHHIGDKDHIYFSWWRQYAAINRASEFPAAIATESPTTPQNSPISRINWEHTFSPTLTHHATFGYLNRNEGYGSLNLDFANQLPKVAGVASQLYLPSFNFSDGFVGISNSTGFNARNVTVRPTYVFNNLLSWVKGNHTLKFGTEWRNAGGNIRNGTNESGSFYFDRATTGAPLQNSGHPIASFLFGAVSSANVDFRTVSAWYPRQNAYVIHGGDTWKATSKLTINYGLRWDVFTPMREKYNRLSFFDPFGPNPGAGNRPGRLAFAGDQYGSASYGADFPEETWKKGFAPRLGIAYSWDQKTVIRTGYGIFYTQAFYPGWGGGMSLDGFNLNQSFSSTEAGTVPAFFIQNGFPQNFTRPPFIRSDFQNGRGILYRPIDANRRPYSQQWNLTIERELPFGITASAAYVGNKGTRLPSNLQPLNILNPNDARVRALGADGLAANFAPGEPVKFAGTPREVRIPYAGWVQQMQGCAPSVAQALLPYPQYCSQLFGLNEGVGHSIFHSFQAKAEKRFSKGVFMLISYTASKLITDAADSTQREASQWAGSGGIVSPFDRRRNRSLAPDDVPQVLSAAFVYELPFGRNKKFLSKGGALDKVIGGWQMSPIYRFSSGIPFSFRSGSCNTGAFAQACFPGILPGKNPFLQDVNNFNPEKPLFDINAFEYSTGRRRADGSIITVFDSDSGIANGLYAGSGVRVTNLRGPNFQNLDLSLIKNTRISERVNFQFRTEIFNLGNWHYFVNAGGFNIGGNLPYDTDVTSPNFGKWTGNVSNPRTIQFGARIEF
ncbi:MAG TPA: carboxypeptidase regulatory-like domain-containing protein [Blastocatellia bacterium]|nr:carboxypeptidase regulatory-like domain-containing protein [Blastocatellia bacterium]